MDDQNARPKRFIDDIRPGSINNPKTAPPKISTDRLRTDFSSKPKTETIFDDFNEDYNQSSENFANTNTTKNYNSTDQSRSMLNTTLPNAYGSRSISISKVF